MKFICTLTAAASLLATLPALAGNTLIDFEGATSFQSVNGFYNGGVDGAGVAGKNFGVSFTGAALAVSNDVLGPYFSNAPTPGTVMFAADATAFMNVAAGFTSELSFYYASTGAAVNAVTVYSGLDGNGSVLGSISLTNNAQSNGCTDSPSCHWELATLAFAGAGKSISFGGNAGNVGFDNISITAVPEPESYALVALGMVGVMLASRRKRQA